MKKNPVGICKLCHQKKKLCYSHIIPEFAWSDIYVYRNDKKQRRVQTWAFEPNSTPTLTHHQKAIREFLLCKDCEGKFAIWEKYVVETLRELFINYSGSKIYTIVDSKIFRLFQLSILWRCAICEYEPFRINLGQHTELLRKLLESNDTGDYDQYGCRMTILTYNNRIQDDLIFQHIELEISKYTCVHIIFYGVIWSYYIEHEVFEYKDFPKPIGFLNSDGTLAVGVSEMPEVTFLMKYAELIFGQQYDLEEEKQMKFSDDFLSVVKTAQEICISKNSNRIQTHHVLGGILQNKSCSAYKILEKLEFNIAAIINYIERYEEPVKIEPFNECEYTPVVSAILHESIREAHLYQCDRVSTAHLLLALFNFKWTKSFQLFKAFELKYYLVRKEVNEIMRPFIVEIYLPPLNGDYVSHFYKYYSEDKAGLFFSLVDNQEIRFTQKEALNDKFDMQIQIDQVTDLTRYKDQVDTNSDEFYLKAKEHLPENFLQNYGEEAFRKDMKKMMPLVWTLIESKLPNIEKHFTSILTPHYEKVMNKFWGVLCLTEDISNNPMWSHYASNYRGFAIQFNANHEYFYTDDAITAVEYSETPPTLDNLVDNQNISERQFLEFFMFNKSEEWRYEKEWRILNKIDTGRVLAHKDASGYQIFLLPMPRETITGIVFGLDFDEENKRKIIEKIRTNEKYKHIKVYNSYLNRKNRKIEIFEIKTF